VDKHESEIGSINSIDILKNQKLSVSMRSSFLYFEFIQDFSLHTINISHLFKRKYDAIFNTQSTMSWLQDKVRNELRDKILYYDGKEWVDHPTSPGIASSGD